MNGLSIFAGNSNPHLADKISEYLAKPLGRLKVNRFSDGETQVEIHENVRTLQGSHACHHIHMATSYPYFRRHWYEERVLPFQMAWPQEYRKTISRELTQSVDLHIRQDQNLQPDHMNLLIRLLTIC